MKDIFAILVLVPILLIAQAGAANYMYEKSSIKGVGYLEQEKIVQTQVGFTGQKLVEHVAGSGNVVR
jgi:hypothetical protein